MATDKSTIFPLEMITSFYAVAFGAFDSATRIAKQRRKYERTVRSQGPKVEQDVVYYLSKNHLTPADEERFAITCIVFSAFTLEALINDYAINCLGKSYLKNYLDRLPPLSKWLIFPKLAAQRELQTSSQTFERLRDLFKLRNELVHFKGPGSPTSSSGKKDRKLRKDAKGAIDTVRLAVKQLKRLDTRTSTIWLRDIETTYAG